MMHCFVIIIIVTIQCCHNTYSVEVEGRSKIFVRSEKESALVGHVIKTIPADSDLECLIQCNKDLRCQSYNYKNAAGGLPVCQLNNVTKENKPDDVVSAKGFYYYGPIEPCLVTNPCQNGGTCKPEINHPTITHTCQCTAEYDGPLCETLASDPNSKFDINFPRRSNLDYVSLQKMPTLTSFTISFTVKLSDNNDHTFISYATTANQNAIFFIQRRSKFQLWVMNNAFTLLDLSGVAVPSIKADGLWHHLVLTWNNTNGQTQLYIDRLLKHSKTGYQTGVTIPGNGLFVLGNDQDKYGGGFVSADALVGSISRVNIWNKVLPTDTIKNLLRSCGNEVGTAVAWRDLRAASYKGLASLKENSTCS